MATMDELRASVRRSFRELDVIEDADLRDKSGGGVGLRALANGSSPLSSKYAAPATRRHHALKQGTQTEHLRGVARIALAMADSLEQVVGPVGINRDLLIACALCHDVGKPFEFSPRNQARWQADPAAVGYPSIRHPLTASTWPSPSACRKRSRHTAGAHSGEGERVERSLENTIVHLADHAFWTILGRAGALTEAD